MTIIEAAKAMQEGKKVKRSDWHRKHLQDDGCFVEIYFREHFDGGPYMPNLDSLLADDWEVVE
ncbi:MAG: Thoeris anti-defense Tad2 family protein [Thermoplasmataceae archaeon]